MVTDQQILDAQARFGSNEDAARELGISVRQFYRRRAKMSKRVASDHTELGYDASVPDGYRIKGVSTLHHAEKGELLSWVKTTQDNERLYQLMMEATQALAEDLPRYDPRPEPFEHGFDSLLNCFVITDYHLGMLSWAEETGDNWDSKIAENLLVRWFERAIDQAPNAGTAVLAQLGDFMHFDGMDAVTPSSGHLLDADGRFAKMVRIAIRLLRHVINRLLDKFPKVHVIMAEGNHDLASSVWLRELFAASYAEEPRVTVDTTPDPYYCYEFGKTSLFFHHGHKVKVSKLDTVLASKFRPVFGRTEYSYAHCGHLHHSEAKETSMMHIEQHRTLAAKDAYASRGGWLSKRGAKVITYSSEFGYIADFNITPEMLK